jgi:hypothetical protein
MMHMQSKALMGEFALGEDDLRYVSGVNAVKISP